MRDLLVVVLTVTRDRVVAGLGEVDRPGRTLREVAVERSAGTDGRPVSALDAAAAALHALAAGDLAPRLLSLAVAVDGDPDSGDASALRAALGDELPDGWGLPASLPVLHGSVAPWATAGAPVDEAPLVAGAVVAAARAVGAHAHLPRG